MLPIPPTAVMPQDLWPKDVHDLVRLGRPYDGAYVVPRRALMAARHLLSIGVNDDWSFDRDAAAMNPAMRLTGVDATTTVWYVLRRGLRFRAEYLAAWATGRKDKCRFLTSRMPSVRDYRGFWGRHTLIHKFLAPQSGPATVALGDLMSAASAAQPAPSVFLKIDIEGAEFGLLDDIVAASDRLTGLAMELHDVPAHQERVSEFLAALRAHLVLVHVHANTYDGVDEQTQLPRVLELTWMARTLLTEPEVDVPGLPRPVLDQPSKYNHREIQLVRAQGGWGGAKANGR